MNLGDMLKTNI